MANPSADVLDAEKLINGRQRCAAVFAGTEEEKYAHKRQSPVGRNLGVCRCSASWCARRSTTMGNGLTRVGGASVFFPAWRSYCSRKSTSPKAFTQGSAGQTPAPRGGGRLPLCKRELASHRARWLPSGIVAQTIRGREWDRPARHGDWDAFS
jgi:hypothetical protein